MDSVLDKNSDRDCDFLWSHPYRRYKNSSHDTLTGSIEREIANKEKCAAHALANDDQSIRGFIELLDWDSKHFNKKIGIFSIFTGKKNQIDQISSLIKAAVNKARKNEFFHLTCTVDATDVNTALSLQSSGFILYDQKLSYQMTRDDWSDKKNSWGIKSAPPQTEDIEELKNLAYSAKFPSRFYRDKFFSREKVQDLHVKWLTNALNKKQSDLAFVVTRKDDGIGFCLSQRVTSPLSSAVTGGLFGQSLSAAFPEGKGLGPASLEAMTGLALQKVATIENVVSASNLTAASCLEKIGYSLSACRLVFHMAL